MLEPDEVAGLQSRDGAEGAGGAYLTEGPRRGQAIQWQSGEDGDGR